MATIKVHGGDFPKGEGMFYKDYGFVLRDREGRPEWIPLSHIEAADHASEISLQIYDLDNLLRGELERAAAEADSVGQKVFIAVFADGRLLLAATDQTTFEEICAPRGMR